MGEFSATQEFTGIVEIDRERGLVHVLGENECMVDLRDVVEVGFEYDKFSFGAGDMLGVILAMLGKPRAASEEQKKPPSMAVVLTMADGGEPVRIDFLNNEAPLLYNVRKAFDSCYDLLKEMHAELKGA